MTKRDPQTFKCAPVGETIVRLRQGFERLGLDLVEEHGTLAGQSALSWVRLRCPDLGLDAAGKGVSAPLAEASALAELAERYSAGLFFRALRYRAPLPGATQVSGYAEFCAGDYLAGYQHIAPALVKDAVSLRALVAPKQLDAAGAARLQAHPLSQHWVRGWSIQRQAPVQVPLALVERLSGSNGLAAGNTWEEAIIQGAGEVLERYAAVTAVLERAPLPTIDPATLPPEPAVKAFFKLCQEQGIRCLIKDFSLGRGLPCIGLLIEDPRLQDSDNPLKSAYAGQRFRVAASPRPREALIRCLTEESQSRWRVFAADASNPYDILWHRFLKQLPGQAQGENPLYPLLRSYEYPGDLGFLNAGPVIPFPNEPPETDCDAEIAALAAQCTRLGSDLVVVDHRHPVLDFPTVRVVVPGISTILCRLDQGADVDLARIAAISDDFCVVGQRFYLEDNWLHETAEGLEAGADLAQALIDQIRQHHSLFVHPSGLPRRPLPVPRLLGPLLARQGHWAGAAACADLLGLMQPQAADRVFQPLGRGVSNPLRQTDDPLKIEQVHRLIQGFY